MGGVTGRFSDAIVNIRFTKGPSGSSLVSSLRYSLPLGSLDYISYIRNSGHHTGTTGGPVWGLGMEIQAGDACCKTRPFGIQRFRHVGLWVIEREVLHQGMGFGV